jgi:hypothetical protein
VVVPVQTLETWLLVIKGHPFTEPSPEQRYARRVLKKDFFGETPLSSREQQRRALGAIMQPDALQRLSLRPSFQHFMNQVLAW